MKRTRVSEKTSYLENMFGLQGRVAIVTGAAGQLGREYVKTLLKAGAAVAALDIRKNIPRSIFGESDPENLLILSMDITRRADLIKTLEIIVQRLGNPKVLVNNAAIDAPPGAGETGTGPFETYPEKTWDAMMEVNLKGTFLCCQVFGGHMAKHGGGSIINVSSIYGMLSPDQRIYQYHARPFFKPVAYSVSKGGILNLSRYLATYWAKLGVRVNTLSPAGVFNDQDPRFLSGYEKKVPLGRMAAATDFNGAILFLASDASTYMTGANLVVDGGFSAW